MPKFHKKSLPRNGRESVIKILPLDTLATSFGLNLPPFNESITDIIVVEFDRALLYGPIPNLDLLDTASSRIVESKLGSANWWESSAVLEAAGKYCGWNEPLCTILDAAIATPSVFTVVVSGRPASSEVTVRRMLEERGLGAIDMLIFSESNKPVLHRKQVLVQALWRNFTGAQRMSVFEGRPRDAKVMSDTLHALAASPYARGVEGFYFEEVIGPLALLPPKIERELIAKLVEESLIAPKTSVVTSKWSHRIDSVSQAKLLEWTSTLPQTNQNLMDSVLLNLSCEELPIVNGELPAVLRGRVTLGASVVWKIMGISIQGQSLIGHAQPIQFQTAPYADRMADRGAPVELARIKQKTPILLPYEPVVGPVVSTTVEETRLLKLRMP